MYKIDLFVVNILSVSLQSLENIKDDIDCTCDIGMFPSIYEYFTF